MAKEEVKLLKYKENHNTQDVQFSRSPPKVDAAQTKTFKSRKRKQSPSKIREEIKPDTLQRARDVQANLDPKFPSLVKYMLPSHVSGCFWLGLPLGFCKSYLPKQDEIMTLITEEGNEYPVKFLAEKTGLSGGWRGFSILHRLVEGDVVVFHLIKATTFKVYIVRQNELAEVDGALSLLGLDSRVEQTDPGKRIKSSKIFQKQCPSSLPRAILQENNRSISPAVSGLDLALPTEPTVKDSDKIDSEVELGMKFLAYAVELKEEFKDVKDAESFTITVNGLNIDRQIPRYVKTKYYELCRSQNSFLHDNLPKVINGKLSAGIISETVNIADAIVASKLTTSQNEFAIWDKSLLAFQKLGMKVGFLRTRLQPLMNLAYSSEQAADSKRYSSEQAADSKRYKEALLRQTQVEEEIKTTELKLLELREASKRFGAEIGALKAKADKHVQKFHDEAAAHW